MPFNHVTETFPRHYNHTVSHLIDGETFPHAFLFFPPPPPFSRLLSPNTHIPVYDKNTFTARTDEEETNMFSISHVTKRSIWHVTYLLLASCLTQSASDVRVGSGWVAQSRKGYVQRSKLTKPVCLTDFTCASYKIDRGMLLIPIWKSSFI